MEIQGAGIGQKGRYPACKAGKQAVYEIEQIGKPDLQPLHGLPYPQDVIILITRPPDGIGNFHRKSNTEDKLLQKHGG